MIGENQRAERCVREELCRRFLGRQQRDLDRASFFRDPGAALERLVTSISSSVQECGRTSWQVGGQGRRGAVDAQRMP